MNWAEQWQLRVAEHKCLVLSHGNCNAPGYYLKDVNLDNVDYHKDLGVIVDNHCLFKQHVSYICKKAYCSTNVLFRCFHTANTAALIRGYKSFICPVLEYCSTVWNPYIPARHFIGMTDQLENVQRYFTPNDYVQVGESSKSNSYLPPVREPSAELCNERRHCLERPDKTLSEHAQQARAAT